MVVQNVDFSHGIPIQQKNPQTKQIQVHGRKFQPWLVTKLPEFSNQILERKTPSVSPQTQGTPWILVPKKSSPQQKTHPNVGGGGTLW